MPSTLKNIAPSIALAGFLSVVVSTGLAGCTLGEPDGNSRDDTVEVSSTETQEYVAASAEGPAQHVPKPVLPDAVRENTVDGAKATVEYFWAAVDYGRMTGDTQHAAQVAHYVCESCNQLIYKWEKIYEDNAWADLHEATEITVLEVQENFDAEREEDWTAIIFEMQEPSNDFYQDGVLDENVSSKTQTSAGWWVEMMYDETAQQWVIDWLDFDASLAE